MAVVWMKETSRGRVLEYSQKGGSGGRAFLVRVDSPSTPLSAICAAPGILIGDVHPDNGVLLCKSISATAGDDAGMLWQVDAKYEPRENKEDNDDEGEQPGSLPGGPYAHWGASSSVSSGPVYRDINGEVMTNSAGDPLEGLEAEQAEFSLTYTEYYLTHADNPPLVGWLTRASDYTNAVNNNVWNGGLPGQWKCQGCSARLSTDNNGPADENGQPTVRYYWEVTWEFKFNKMCWRLTPWDIGFNELVDEDGNPSPVESISPGADDGGSGS